MIPGFMDKMKRMFKPGTHDMHDVSGAADPNSGVSDIWDFSFIDSYECTLLQTARNVYKK